MVEHMALGAFLQGFGHHQAGWRDPSTDPGSELTLEHYQRMAQTAERGLFDLVFLADVAGWRDWNRDTIQHLSRTAIFEPITLLSALAVSTRNIGLIATASTSYYEPFTVARMFNSIDRLSGGRAGWNLVTSTTEAEAQNFSREHQIPHAERYARASEFADVVRGLWDCWAADAVLVDKESGNYLNPGRVRELNHKGPYFQVRGPMNMARAVQGTPLIVQAGSSGAGMDLAARTADLVFTAQPTLESGQAFYADLKGRLPGHGRAPDSLRILPGLVAIIGSTEAEAQAKAASLEQLVHHRVGIGQLRDLLGVDLTDHDPDGPLPEIPETEGGKSRRQILIDMAKRDNLSIRQLYQKTAAARGFLAVTGTPEQVADAMELWFRNGAADGFNLMPPVMSRDLDDFVDHVVPVLQKRGLMRRNYAGATLRENLGLAKPASIYDPAG